MTDEMITGKGMTDEMIVGRGMIGIGIEIRIIVKEGQEVMISIGGSNRSEFIDLNQVSNRAGWLIVSSDNQEMTASSVIITANEHDTMDSCDSPQLHEYLCGRLRCAFLQDLIVVLTTAFRNHCPG